MGRSTVLFSVDISIFPTSGIASTAFDIKFITAFEKTVNLATAATVEYGQQYAIHTPAIGMTKRQIILQGKKLGVDFSLTHSCYDPDDKGRACGRCDSCQFRLKGFAEAGLKDTVEYVL